MDIGLTFYQNVMQKSDEDAGEAGKEKGEDLMSKIRGFTFVFFLDREIFFFLEWHYTGCLVIVLFGN